MGEEEVEEEIPPDKSIGKLSAFITTNGGGRSSCQLGFSSVQFGILSRSVRVP